MSDNKQTGIETLRRAVNLFSNCNDTFNETWTAAQLVAIYEAFQGSDWDITPDRWTERQINEALEGRAPTWDDDQEPTYD